MDVWMIVLRLLHILSGVFWAGATFHMASFVTPAVVASGDAGQKFMQQLGLRSKFSPVMGVLATLTFLTGLIMYWRSSGFRIAWITSGYGLVLTIGAIAGTVAAYLGFATQFRTVQKMKSLFAEMQSAGGPPQPEQISQMQSYAEYLGKSGAVLAVILAIAVTGMAVAQYVTF